MDAAECCSLTGMESPTLHCQRGGNCPLVTCVLGRGVGKGLDIAVVVFPDELFLEVYLSVLSHVSPTWFFRGCKQASKMVAQLEKHMETL